MRGNDYAGFANQKHQGMKYYFAFFSINLAIFLPFFGCFLVQKSGISGKKGGWKKYPFLGQKVPIFGVFRAIFDPPEKRGFFSGFFSAHFFASKFFTFFHFFSLFFHFFSLFFRFLFL